MGERKRKEEAAETTGAQIADLGRFVRDGIVRTCGNCEHGVVGRGPDGSVDFNIRVCYGVPATPVVYINQHTGQVVSVLQMARAVNHRSTRACGAHWELKEGLLDGGKEPEGSA